MDSDVLVVGAGPSGLVLALWLKRLGVRVRIIDKSREPGTTSRAVVVQARTLEFYRQLGLADEVVRAGLEFSKINLWAGATRRAHADFGHLGEGLSPYPYALIYPQDEHERLLVRKLEEQGVRVERETELAGLENRADAVDARVGGATHRTAFVAGCDGAHSTVRASLGLRFGGGTYEHLFYVADVDARGPLVNRELHVSIDEADFIAVFPLSATGRIRLIGTVRENTAAGARPLGWDDVRTTLLERLHVEIERVNWFSTYHVHHRVAERFRLGRTYLVGDAAHVHSPVGGQGMNTGIGDAVNLAWKLAEVVKGRGSSTLLDSYEPERIAFARRLVATTDRAFQFVTRTSPLAARVRKNVAPHLIEAAVSFAAARRLLFRTISQTAIEYRASALSDGHAGHVHGGDRLPWVRPDGSEPDNFEVLGALAWQAHVYGRSTGPFAQACERLRVPLHVFPWSERAEQAGFARDASYLVRPDGYVALADPEQEPARLEKYVEARGLASA